MKREELKRIFQVLEKRRKIWSEENKIRYKRATQKAPKSLYLDSEESLQAVVLSEILNLPFSEKTVIKHFEEKIFADLTKFFVEAKNTRDDKYKIKCNIYLDQMSMFSDFIEEPQYGMPAKPEVNDDHETLMNRCAMAEGVRCLDEEWDDEKWSAHFSVYEDALNFYNKMMEKFIEADHLVNEKRKDSENIKLTRMTFWLKVLGLVVAVLSVIIGIFFVKG